MEPTGVVEPAKARWKVAAKLTKEVPDFRKWPENPVLTAREEIVSGQHAGILTAPNFIFF